VAAAESRETAISEALNETKDWHAHQLEEAYLVTRAKRRTLAAERHAMMMQHLAFRQQQLLK